MCLQRVVFILVGIKQPPVSQTEGKAAALRHPGGLFSELAPVTTGSTITDTWWEM